MTKIKRKYCRLHGWAPHRTFNSGGFFGIPVENIKRCCRCHPPRGYTKTAKIKAFLRGFKLPERVSAKAFIGARFNEPS